VPRRPADCRMDERRKIALFTNVMPEGGHLA
jgi:hypothetical protein